MSNSFQPRDWFYEIFWANAGTCYWRRQTCPSEELLMTWFLLGISSPIITQHSAVDEPKYRLSCIPSGRRAAFVLYLTDFLELKFLEWMIWELLFAMSREDVLRRLAWGAFSFSYSGCRDEYVQTATRAFH